MNRNSGNSSQPPSQDGPKGFKAKPKEKSGKKRGGQLGHQGQQQQLYEPEQCQRIEEHYPPQCWQCGGALSGEDRQPQRCQIAPSASNPLYWIAENTPTTLDDRHGNQLQTDLPLARWDSTSCNANFPFCQVDDSTNH